MLALLPSEWTYAEGEEFTADYTIADKTPLKVYVNHWDRRHIGPEFELQNSYMLVAAKMIPDRKPKLLFHAGLGIINIKPANYYSQLVAKKWEKIQKKKQRMLSNSNTSQNTTEEIIAKLIEDRVDTCTQTEISGIVQDNPVKRTIKYDSFLFL